MARRTIRVIDVVELLMHWHAGRRMSELQASLGVDPKTVRKYGSGARGGHRAGRAAAERGAWAEPDGAERWSRDELRAAARTLGVPGYSRMTKTQLLAVIAGAS